MTVLEDVSLSSGKGRHEGHHRGPEVAVRAKAVGILPEERHQVGEGLLSLCLSVTGRS